MTGWISLWVSPTLYPRMMAAGLISYCKQTLDAAKLQIDEIDASLLAKAEDVQ